VRPLRTNWTTQKFGENRMPIYKQLGMKGHNGIDWKCYYKEPIHWDCLDCEGKVVRISTEENEGLGVVVRTEDKDGIFEHRFWHFKKIKCKVGQVLSSGDLIGLGDSTGYSTGDHLHRDLKPIPKDYSNGYRGAIDPQPFIENIFIRDYMNNLTGQISVIKKIIKLITDFLKVNKR